MIDALVAPLIRSEAPAMVAAALRLLALMAESAPTRRQLVAPWGWNLRMRARELEHGGQASAAAEARAIARLVEAVALGHVATCELRSAAASLDASDAEVRGAMAQLELVLQLATVA